MIDPQNFLSYSVWLSLPMETRYKIAALFHIEPRGIRETMFGHGGGRVISDGFIHSDLAVITKEEMAKITENESDDFYIQFQALVDKVEGKLNQQNDVQQEEQTEIEPRAEAQAPRGRGGRKAKRSIPEG